MDEGHGDHWEAIEPDLDRVMSDLIPLAMQNSRVHASHNFEMQYGGDPRKWSEKAVGLLYGDSGLGVFSLVISMSAPPQQRNVMVTAYPACVRGVETELTLVSVKPFENGVEAVVNATTHGGDAGVWFFDPFYYRSMGVYAPGRRVRVSLGALAMKVRKNTQDRIEVKGPLLHLERERVLREDPKADVSKLDKVVISLEGAAMYLPASEDHNPSEAQYLGVVEELERFDLAGRSLLAIRTTLMRPEGGPVGAWLYASESVLGGYEPQRGDSLEGVIWLQGHIVG